MISTLLTTLLLTQNSAVVPANKLNEEWWDKRHQAVISEVNSNKQFELALIGDSITHGWGGIPYPNDTWKGVAPSHFDEVFGKYKPLNMGFSGDRTQHVLWRLDNGSLGKQNWKVCMVMIGTNNMSVNTPQEIAEGVVAITKKIHDKAPSAKVLLCSILPREHEVGEIRKKVAETNQILGNTLWPSYVEYVPCWDEFLRSDGIMKDGLMPDQLHPNAEGYKVWGDIVSPILEKLMRTNKLVL